MTRKATYASMKSRLSKCRDLFAVLSGDEVGPSGTNGWQDVALDLAAQLEGLHQEVLDAANGRHEEFICFPSMEEVVEEAQESAG